MVNWVAAAYGVAVPLQVRIRCCVPQCAPLRRLPARRATSRRGAHKPRPQSQVLFGIYAVVFGVIWQRRCGVNGFARRLRARPGRICPACHCHHGR
jgi:hypothetical protein